MLEAEEKPGGRINTLELENGYLDLGAQWLHGTTNDLWSLSNRNELFSNKVIEEGKGLYIREDGYIFDSFLINKIDFIFGEILEECEKFVNSDTFPKSVGSYVSEKFSEYLKNAQLSEEELRLYMELYDWNIRFQIIDNSCESLHQLSAKDWGEYSCETDNGQTHVSFKKGLYSIIDTLEKQLPNNTIHTLCPVKNIKWDTSPIIITLENKAVLCNSVILTPSIGVLKASSDLFTPKLPERLSKTIDSMGFNGICKIFLEFPNKWWDVEGFQLIWKWDKGYGNDWTRYMTGFDLVHGQENMLIGWVGGRGAELVEGVTEEDIGITCTKLLRKFTKKDIPYPVRVFR